MEKYFIITCQLYCDTFNDLFVFFKSTSYYAPLITLLVERIYSIVALRTFVLESVSNELLPKRRVLIKTGSQRSRKLLSVFTRVLRRARLSIIYVEQ